MSVLTLNVIAVFNETCDKVLLCVRKKDPYQGLSNFVGGKAKPGEDSRDAAYRELEEETGITRQDITLTHVMDFTYQLTQRRIELFAGKLNKPVTLYGEENDLYWSPLDCNFFDMTKYAGEGNMGHMMEVIRYFAHTVLA